MADEQGQNAMREGRAWRYLLAKRSVSAAELGAAAWGAGAPGYINLRLLGERIGDALCRLGKAKKAADGFELKTR